MGSGKQKGFTLIELMITVAIVGLLASLAYPSYTSHIRKGVRRAAQAQMMDIANREQQYLLANRVFASYDTLTLAGYSFPTDLSTKYTPTIAVVGGTTTAPGFTITFTAIGAQTQDGNLTLSSEGVKGPVDKW